MQTCVTASRHDSGWSISHSVTAPLVPSLDMRQLRYVAHRIDDPGEPKGGWRVADGTATQRSPAARRPGVVRGGEFAAERVGGGLADLSAQPTRQPGPRWTASVAR